MALFASRVEGAERLRPVFRNAGIRTRRFVRPLSWFGEPHSFVEKNEAYVECATELGSRAARLVLDRASLSPADADALFYVNTTGLATPSIDARIMNTLDMRPDVRRTPIWGLGCAGGVAGLARAYDHARAYPTHRVLLVAVELCGLTFVPEDASVANVVASALFADGAAAALVVGDEVDVPGLAMGGTMSTFYPDSLSVMGWTVMEHGLQVVFDRRIPDIVSKNAAGELERFLRQEGVGREDVRAFPYHPGGVKVLAAYERAYGVDPDAFRDARAVLEAHGNMSSVTVLYVLERLLSTYEPGGGGVAVVSALGPGFSSDMLLLRL